MKKAELDSLINRLTDMNLSELNSLVQAANGRIVEVKQEERARLDATIKAEIEKSGFSVDEFFKPASGSQGPRTIRFQDKTNPANVWGGRGKKPKWLEERLAKGDKLEDFKVTEQGAHQQAA
jgi:DNA-binding protein H-NS